MTSKLLVTDMQKDMMHQISHNQLIHDTKIHAILLTLYARLQESTMLQTMQRQIKLFLH